MADLTGAASKRVMFGARAPLPEPMAGGIADDIAKLAARLKISEERYSDLRKKLLLIEQNMLLNQKKAMNEIKVLHSEITEINSRINEIQDRILLIIKELKLTARREDVDVMKKYVELWNPLRFVTRDQVENIVKEIIDSQESSEKKPKDTPKDL